MYTLLSVTFFLRERMLSIAMYLFYVFIYIIILISIIKGMFEIEKK